MCPVRRGLQLPAFHYARDFAPLVENISRWLAPGGSFAFSAEHPVFTAYGPMAGDSLTSDIRGGRNAGMATCWFNPQKKPGRKDIRPGFEIYSLEDLPQLLAGYLTR